MENLERLHEFSECFGLLINGGSICSVTHILEILPLMVCRSSLRGLKLRGSNVFAWDPPEDSASVSLDFCLWELCFSLVSPLWESCYSLASR